MKKIKLTLEHIRGRIACRRGMGMELALLVLLVVFACSTLLVSSALIGSRNLQDKEDQLLQELVLDTLAERALAGDVPSSDDTRFADYALFQKTDGGEWDEVLRNDDSITLNSDDTPENADLVITNLEGDPMLCVACDDDGKIVLWSYNR